MRRAGAKSGSSLPGRSHGFSLIELLIVVTIILVIVAIAIPNLLRSRIAANESSAVQSLRTIVSAELVYSSTYSNGFSPALATLSGGGAVNCDTADLLDPVLVSGVKGGYRFTYSGANALPAPGPGCSAAGFGSFQLNADPIAVGVTGVRHFYTDDGGVIRANTTGAASATDSPIS
jgi:prepilin-type N-terminal cleavage/methylation domain-containing protein